ncbi:beta-galactosidase [Algibacillus agarilyticus]|uniref:beta-galactosidase n=1 Tax=Algibacillus agarilyticus TaxID=2234133 RepID=UPI000DD0BBB4|nr:beta-galactosidase [Algibacillus agarilyticus]
MNKSTFINSALATVMAGTLLVSCSAPDKTNQKHSKDITTQEKKVTSLLDFESSLPNWLSTLNTTTSLITDRGVTSGNQSLLLNFSSDEQRAHVLLKPQNNWDWSHYSTLNLATDITNPTSASVNLHIEITDHTGWPHIRSVSIPAHSTGTYYALLKGEQLAINSGLREDPKSWQSTDHKMFWLRGRKQLALDKISSIKYFVDSINFDKRLILDNIRLRENPATDPNFLVGLSDKFGQSAKFDFPAKVKSDKHLKQLAQTELAQLEKEGPMADRSQYGGWKSGPKLKATGFFRTVKINGKWAMVDPEGHLFFSSALANIRIANTTTITGIDFKDDSVRYIDPEDVTPEDSLGIRPVSKEAQKSRYVASEMRHKMFTDLPSYDDELANHYSYRRTVHKGPLHHGETFSFYQANLERRYGETSTDSYLDDWRDVTIKRFKNWGFTSTGNWTDASFYQMDRIPYFANGWIIGDFKTVSSGADVWSPMPDPFDPEFARRALVTTKVIAQEVKNNPWCVGVFIDNEKSWGNQSTPRGHYGIVIHTLNRPATESPSKAHFMKILKNKYSSINALNSAWQLNLASWSALDKGYAVADMSDAMLADFSILLEAYATEYFKIVHNALAQTLPNHMYMGVRMAHWGMTPEAVKAAAKYVDVMSYNFYKEGLHAKAWTFLAEVDKPSIIGEFHFGATNDTGLYHPGLIHASDQKDRAKMYTDYMNTVIDNPYMVGAHWFQYIDSPITGRAYDGENYNVGFVTMADVPYEEMVNAAKKLNATLYQRRFGQ